MNTDEININSIRAKANKLSEYIIHTPTTSLHSAVISKLMSGCKIFLKLECMQHTGTFKARGAISVASEISKEQKKFGDTAASAIAKKLKSRRLLLMTNVEGVYDDQKKLISEIKPLDLENLIKWKVVQGGMIPKIQNCVDAVENGVRGVVILDGRKPHSILHEIFSDQGSGTLIRE